MKLRKTAVVCAAAMLLSTSVFAEENAPLTAPNDEISVVLDGEKLAFDQQPIMQNDRVLVPFRGIFEALGCTVDYQNSGTSESVNAKMGTKNLYLTIGSTEIWYDNEAKTIDVVPQIVNDRTLVPVRVASESFGALVEWIEETNTVNITSKQGFYKIHRATVTETKENADGVKLMDILCHYPVFEANEQNAEFISAINADFKNSTAAFIEELTKEEDIAGAEEYYNSLEDKSAYVPYTFDFDYDINLNTEDYLSATVVLYFNYNGAHPMTTRTSVSYDMKAQKEIDLTDVWNMDEVAVKNEIIALFSEQIDENPEMYFEDAKETLEKIADTAEFCIDENGVNLYFQLYDLMPYAGGYPYCAVPFEGNEQLYKITLAK